MSEMTKVEMHLHRILGNVEYNGIEPKRDDEGKVIMKGEKRVMVDKKNVHLVIFDPTIRGGLKEKFTQGDGTKTKDGKSFPHCATIPINVGEVIAKAAVYAVQNDEPEALAKVMVRLTTKNRAKRAVINGGKTGGASAAPVFLSVEDES